jgi:hypothetical protein
VPVPRCVLACALALAALGCGGDDDAASDDAAVEDAGNGCLAPLPDDCTAAYPPSYDAIYDNLLRKSCGSAATGSTCHYGPTPDTAQGGLVLSDRDKTYDYLLGTLGGRARVIPGDPECSVLVQRLESKDAALRMPRGGDPLPPNVRCVVRKWIESGAERGGGE